MHRQPAELDDGWYDLLVVGGGIYGAWIAYDAALRGLRVAVVEQNDWGSGTSSASSKLIHGGLRYLEYGHFGLVMKTLQERSRLLRLGPHRVWPLRFVMPLTETSRVGRLAMSMGLHLYDRLAGRNAGVAQHRYVMREELMAHHPWSVNPEVRGGFLYSDAGTDDARLTLEIIAGAIQAGATAINHANCTSLERDHQGVVIGAKVSDLMTGSSHLVRARLTMVTAGPWCAQVLGREPGPVRYSKGVHLVLPPLPGVIDGHGSNAMLLTAPQDGRVFFLIPWYGATLLGTTDTEYHGKPQNVGVDERDQAYLLAAVNARCPALGWTSADVRGSFAGLRTLVGHSSVGAPSSGVGSMSREWALVTADKQLLVSVGGKLTSARLEAERTVDRCCQLLNRRMEPCTTGQRLFPWAPCAKGESWMTWFKRTCQLGVELGLDRSTAATSARRYGRRIDLLFGELKRHPLMAKRLDARYPLCQAEIAVACQHEMAMTDEDVFRRRIPLMPLGMFADKTDLPSIFRTLPKTVGPEVKAPTDSGEEPV
jgi:glycerol-3-phosphate dehydrogenase